MNGNEQLQKNNGVKKQKSPKSFELRAMEWIGSTASLYTHTVFFIGIFLLHVFGVRLDEILLVLTTAVSLEAIYMAIFIQMAINRTNQSLKDVEEDIEEIQEDVGELQEDVGEIQADVSEIQEDVGEIQDDFDGVQKDFDELHGQSGQKKSISPGVYQSSDSKRN